MRILVNFNKIFQLTKFFGEFYMIFFLSVFRTMEDYNQYLQDPGNILHPMLGPEIASIYQ
jgi:hypothetical protein